MVKEVAKEQGLEDIDVTPHIFRHSCCIHLIHNEEWEVPKARDRMRHGSEKAMATYAKKHLLIRNEGRLDEAARDRGQWLWEEPAVRMGLLEHPDMQLESSAPPSTDPFSNFLPECDVNVDEDGITSVYPALCSLDGTQMV